MAQCLISVLLLVVAVVGELVAESEVVLESQWAPGWAD
jgi:hypothetical protein